MCSTYLSAVFFSGKDGTNAFQSLGEKPWFGLMLG